MDNTKTNDDIQNQLGVPPVPPMPPVGTTPDGGEMTPADAMAAELANTAPEPIKPITSEGDEASATLDALVTEAPSADGSTEVVTEEATVSAPVSDLDAIKKSMLKDLFPLMDKVNVTPDQRYRIYREMIEDSGDKTLISAAYDAAKGIEDETAKAEALLFLVEQADK